MTKEMIKAIRLVNGYNPSLKVSLNSSAHSCYYRKIQNFIIDHLIDLYGTGIVDSLGVSYCFGSKPEEYKKVLEFTDIETIKVLSGDYD